MNSSSLSVWTQKFSIESIKFSNDPHFEVRCAAITFYYDVLRIDPTCFLCIQEQIWEGFYLSQKIFEDFNIESEGVLHYL